MEALKDLNGILAAVPSAVIGRDMSGFARDSFKSSMARYDEETRGLWEALQAYVNTHPEEREKVVRLAAKTLVAVWPKQDYRFITLDKIEQGFQKKWYQCFISRP